MTIRSPKTLALSTLAAVPLALAGLTRAAPDTSILAAPVAAASASPQIQYLNDPAPGTTFTFTVSNTGATEPIGAVQIARPSSGWTIHACPDAPTGWTTTQSEKTCRYRSDPGTPADDIAPDSSSSAFQISVSTIGGTVDRKGSWKVTVSSTTMFADPANLAQASSQAPGLALTVHTFQLTDAGIPGSLPTAGDPCPALTKSAAASSTQTLVVCGRNRSDGALTPSSATSTLGGDFLASSGAFSSGVIAPGSAASTPVVLGLWSGATVAASVGAGKTLDAVIAAGSTQTSPSTNVTGFEVVAANQAPTDIALSNVSVDENQPAGTSVGTFSTTDPDAGDTHAYTLVSGAGDSDNGSFQIVGNQLQTNASFNFEADSSYSIRVRTSDSGTGSLFFEEQFTITVVNVNEAPTDIALSNASVDENQPLNTVVGSFSSTDADSGQTHSYTLVSGTGDTDNASFNISGSQLRTSAIFNFEADSSYSIRVRTTDSGSPAMSFEEVLTITVTNVNEAPTDIALSNASVDENQPLNTVVSSFSSTDPDSGQTHSYTLVSGTGDTDNASFNISGSQLRTSAIFNFEADSSYSIRVRTTDDGTGSLTYEEQFTITITNVNEAPVNTVPGAQSVNEDTDLNFTGGAAISIADPDGTSTNVKLSLDVLNGTLTFASVAGLTFVDGTANGQASVHVTGTVADINTALSGLKYRGTAHWNSTRGTETLTIVTNDQGNTGSGGPLSDTDTVAVTVNAVNDKPVALAKSFNVQTNMKSNDLSGLLTGASDPDTGDGGYTATFSLASVTLGTCTGCTVSDVQSGGSFDVDPPGGATGSLTLTYTITDSGNPGPAATSDPQTITLSISGPVIWFVNPTSGSDSNKGTLSSPFQTITQAATVDAAGHRIFVFSAGTATGAIALNSNEWLIGQAATGPFDTLFGITPPAETIARPAMSAGTTALNGTVTLATNAKVQGIALVTTTNTGLTGSGGITGVSVSESSISTTTGTALLLNGVAGTMTFSDVSHIGAGTGIDLTGTHPTLTITAGTIQNTTGTGISINGGNANFSYAGTITNSAGRSLNLQSHTGGTATFSGLITDTGQGINLSSNTGGTISFTGGLSLTTGANDSFTATGGGTVTATQNNTSIVNTLSTTAGTALRVTGTTIGAGGLTFRSISSGSASNSSSNGIILDTTGSSGGLTVTGNGSAGTGGTIQHKTGADGSATQGTGIYLNSTSSVALAWMQLHDFQNFGIRGFNVSGLTLANSVVNTTAGYNGDNAGLDEGTVSFDNLTGTVGFTGVSIEDALEANVRIINTTGTLNMTVSGSTFKDTHPTSGLQGLLLQSGVNAGDTANITANITTSTFSNNFARGIQAVHNQGGTMEINVGTSAVGSGGTFASNFVGVDIAHNSSGTTHFNVKNATFTVSAANAGPPVNVFMGSQSTVGSSFMGRVHANDITGANNQGHAGISVVGSGAGTMTLAVTNNMIDQIAQRGITVAAGQGSNTVNATITGNNVNLQDPNSAEAIFATASVNAADTSTMNATIGGAGALQNSVFSVGGAEVRVEARFGRTFVLPGYAQGAQNTAQVNAFTAANNNINGGTTSSTVGLAPMGSFVGAPPTPVPTNSNP